MEAFGEFSLYEEGEETASRATALSKTPRCEIRQEKWAYLKDWAKQHRKDYKLRKKERKERGEDVVFSKRVRFNPAARLDAVTIYIDCQFEEIMTERERVQTAKQLHMSYGTTRRSEGVIKLRITDVGSGGRIEKQLEAFHAQNWTSFRFSDPELPVLCFFDQWLSSHPLPLTDPESLSSSSSSSSSPSSGSSASSSDQNPFRVDREVTKVTKGSFLEEIELESQLYQRRKDLVQSFLSVEDERDLSDQEREIMATVKTMPPISSPKKVVYLTSDSPTVIQDLSQDCCYVIGGVVDRNRLKNLTFDAANEMGVETAALPIGQFLTLSGLNVLTINQVFDILAHFLTNGRDWEKAFFSVIPLRKVDHNVPEE